MKHMFPNVRPRRLGQRGNSRYCYSGLRKKVSFDKPELPDLYKESNNKHDSTSDNVTSTDDGSHRRTAAEHNNNDTVERANENDEQLEESLNTISNDKNLVLSASSQIILEWAMKRFGLKLTNIKDLAKHLILMNETEKESMAALTVIASDDNYKDDFNSFEQELNNGKKSCSDLRNKLKSAQDNDSALSLKKLSPSSDKRDKSSKKKGDLKMMVNKKPFEATGKMQKTIKIKKNKIKKLKPIASKIKLESFDNLTNHTINPTVNENEQMNPINEINETKNTQEFIENTQQLVDLNQSNNNPKRRHSTICINENAFNRTNQLIDTTNNKYQMKRQTSEQFTLTNKKRPPSQQQQQQSNGFGQFGGKEEAAYNFYTPIIEQTAKNNHHLVSYKKHFEANPQRKLNETANLGHAPQQADSMMPITALNHTTISTQVDQDEPYRFNQQPMFEDVNQRNMAYGNTTSTAVDIYTPKVNQIPISYTNEATLSNMCNVNTQMPSIPPSPIQSQKENPFANQFSMMNDKIDFNNNLTTSGMAYTSFPDEQQQIQQMNNCPPPANNQFAHQLNSQLSSHMNNQPNNEPNNEPNNQKIFLNPQQTLISKNNSSGRNQVRNRHSSGPGGHHYMTHFNGNPFLPNSNLTGIRSSSLSPLWENHCVDNLNQKMNNFNNNNNFSTDTNNNHSSIVKFASSPVSPVSCGESMSENLNALIDQKKMSFHNFRGTSKFSNNLVATTKKDGSRSASFTSSLSGEAAAFASRPRNRHMSSPYMGTSTTGPSSSSNPNNPNNYSFSTQSLTNSPTALSAPFNNSDVFFNPMNQVSQSMNLINHSSNNSLSHPGNLNLQDSYVSSLVASSTTTTNKTNYELPLSPPLSSTIQNEEKAFKSLKSSGDCLMKSNEMATKMLQANQHWPNQHMNIAHNQSSFERVNAIQEFNSNLANQQTNKTLDQPIIDDLQTTLQDLKDMNEL